MQGKKLKKYNDSRYKNGKYDVKDERSSRCSLLVELHQELIKVTKDKINELEVMAGGGGDGGNTKNDKDFYMQCKSTGGIDFTEEDWREFIKRNKNYIC